MGDRAATRRKVPCWLCKLTRDMVERLERGTASRLDGGAELVAEVREGAATCEACGENPWRDDAKGRAP